MFVSSSRIQKQFDYLASKGIDVTPLYKQSGILREDILNPEKIFDFEQFNNVLEFALRQTRDPDYGLDFGNQPHLAGTIGMMSASCANLKEAFVQGCKFMKLQADIADLSFIDDDSSPKLVYKLADSWMLESPETAKVEVDAMFAYLNSVLKINSNSTIKPKQINLVAAKPDHIEKYIEIFGITPHFNTEENEFIFSNAALMIPMKAFNPETFNLLNTHLQSQLARFDNTELLTDKVKRILHASFKYNFPDIETVADKLNLSARTLQRKLSDEQTTFKDILMEARFGIAKKLLKQNSLTISEISYTLGYSDIGNFSRSFKKITGSSPQEYREKL